MRLPEALGVTSADEIDLTRPLRLGPFELGLEATAEAVAIMAGATFPKVVALNERPFFSPTYWSIRHSAEGDAELFGFPIGTLTGLPTALEVALVRATAALAPERHALLWAGGVEVVLGPSAACASFRDLARWAEQPMAGTGTQLDGYSQVAIEADSSSFSKRIAINCLVNSYRTSPLKFRFLELYRVMEALFLADIKEKLIAAFDAEPSAALVDAVDALKSELKQITALAEDQQSLFIDCWTALDEIKLTNRFAAALFRRVQAKGAGGGGKWKTGAALVYQARCAVVHAGGKDMIYENFKDGEDALSVILPYVEQAALRMVGMTVI